MKTLGLWILLLPTIFYGTNTLSAPLTVAIDAGHGGIDRGTTFNGVHESDINLKVANLLAEHLKRDPQFRPLLTRADSRGMSLAERALAVKEKGVNLLISIHVNSSPEARARGAEFYFQNQLEADEESMFLAHKENGGEADAAQAAPTYSFLEHNRYPNDVASIVADLLNSDRVWRSSKLAKSLKREWRGNRKSKANSVRQAPFFVLNQLTVPSSLVELGFLTNSDDFRELTNSESLKAMANDLYRGLKTYKESLDKNQLAF